MIGDTHYRGQRESTRVQPILAEDNHHHFFPGPTQWPPFINSDLFVRQARADLAMSARSHRSMRSNIAASVGGSSMEGAFVNKMMSDAESNVLTA